MNVASPVVLVHGGAGNSGKDEAGYRAGIEAAVNAGHRVVEDGGDCVAAAVAAVVAMEDNPVFNAGYGSVLNARGEVECDAAVMRGRDLKFGSIAAVRGVKNPVRLALLVLDSPQVMFAGEGAVRFGEEHGLARCDPAELVTQERFMTWAKWLAEGSPAVPGAERLEGWDTVGAVALDAHGDFAAATSTGGVNFKPPGRVGDSPLPGCGFWADRSGASSSTGEGEYIARVLLCHRAVALVNQFEDGAEAAMREMETAVGGHGGLIALDARGHVYAARNTPIMGHGWRRLDMPAADVRGTRAE
jgi:beta-aspartyl-peptidase (threonine type)